MTEQQGSVTVSSETTRLQRCWLFNVLYSAQHRHGLQTGASTLLNGSSKHSRGLKDLSLLSEITVDLGGNLLDLKILHVEEQTLV